MSKQSLDRFIDVEQLRQNIETAKQEVEGFHAEVKARLESLSKLSGEILRTTTVSGGANNRKAAENDLIAMRISVEERERLLKKMDAAVAASRRLEIEGAKEAMAIQKELAKQAKDRQAAEAASRKLDIAGAKEALAIQKEVERQSKQKEAAMKREEKAATELANADLQLTKQIRDMEAAYKQSYLTLGQHSKITIGLRDEVNALKKVQNDMNTSIGNYRANVGNYSSAWNGLGVSIQQVARELPNFGQSMQLGIMAISNNLPILADELKLAKDRIAALKAEGKDAPSLFTQISSAVFSWQTALTIGITLMTAYGSKLYDFITGQTEASKKLKEEQEALAEARERERKAALKQAADEQVAAAILYATATDMTQAYDLRKQAVDKLQQSYPNYFANLSTEAIMAGEAAAQYNELNKALLVKASITAGQKQLERLSEETNEIEGQIKKQKELLKQIDSKPNSEGQYQAELAKTNKLELQLMDKNKERQAILDDILDKQKQISKLLIEPAKPLTTSGGRSGRGRTASEAKDDMENTGQAGADIFTQIMDELELLTYEIQAKTAENIEKVAAELEAGVITVSQYQARKKEIIESGEREILEVQMNRLSEVLNAYGFSEETTYRLKQEYYDKGLQLLKQETSDEEAELMERAKIRERFNQINAKNQADAIEYNKRVNRAQAEYLARIGRELAQLAVKLLNEQIEAEVRALEKRKEFVAEEYDSKRAAVDASFANEKEKSERKTMLALEEKQAQDRIDQEIRKQRRKQAELEKLQALASIAINTARALADAKNLSLLGALSPFILGLAAVQAAAVIATPIPEYATGKKEGDNYEGPAIAGEAGTEVWKKRDGSIEVLTKPSLIQTKAGDRIYSNKELREMADKSRRDTLDTQVFHDMIRNSVHQTNREISVLRENTEMLIDAIYATSADNALILASKYARA